MLEQELGHVREKIEEHEAELEVALGRLERMKMKREVEEHSCVRCRSTDQVPLNRRCHTDFDYRNGTLPQQPQQPLPNILRPLI